MMKIETLTNIINNLWQDEDINRLALRLKWEDMTCQELLDCRDAVALDSDQVECVINDAITGMLLKIMKEAENRFTGPIEIGPVKYVRISKSYLDPKIMECHATLEGKLVPQFKEEEND
jgi:hypothetical protein